MKNYSIFILALIFMVTITYGNNLTIKRDKDTVTVDYPMAERAIDWLEFINTGPDNKAIKQYFMTKVAPTKGCKPIIHHWRRFMKWNNDEFLKFIMGALNKIPTD